MTLRSRWLFVVRALAAAIVLVACVRTWFAHSLVVAGTRWFWVDDDQMVTMRYARNLAEGVGAVFNPGERVEGYTNPLWMAVMAVVHLVVRDEAKISLFVAAIALACALSVLALADRLVAALRPDASPIVHAAVLVPLALSIDLLYWTAHGFETPFLVALFLGAFVAFVGGRGGARPRLAGLAAMSLVPLVRSDGHLLWAALAASAVALHRDRKRTALLVAVTLGPALVHLAARRAYYGDWLPNTYYLKVVGVPDRLRMGLEYGARTARTYAFPILVTLLAVHRRRDALSVAAVATLAAVAVQIVGAGGDTFRFARVFAPALPVVLAFAAAELDDVLPSVPLRRAGAGALAVTVIASSGALTKSALLDNNGLPDSALIAALTLRENAAPDARIAIIAAGMVPYFSRRPTVDLLGKTDPRIARLPGHAGALHGHAKFDHAEALGRGPDYLVLPIPQRLVDAVTASPQVTHNQYIKDLVLEPIFRSTYLPNRVALPELDEVAAIYVSPSSPDYARRTAWRPIPTR